MFAGQWYNMEKNVKKKKKKHDKRQSFVKLGRFVVFDLIHQHSQGTKTWSTWSSQKSPEDFLESEGKALKFSLRHKNDLCLAAASDWPMLLCTKSSVMLRWKK